VYRRRGKRCDTCVIESQLMVWGGMMGFMKTDLIVVQGIMNANR